MKYLLAYLFCLSTWLDFISTYLFMGGRAIPEMEANPLASLILSRWGWYGLAGAVGLVDLVVVSALMYIWRTNQTLATRLGVFACLASNAVVIHNLLLVCSLLPVGM